jgi:hypothetical protein
VSEYTLYGRFAQDVLATRAGQFVSPSSLCHDYYKRVPLSAPDLDALLDRLSPEEVAVSLTSKAGMRPDHYVELLERRWAGSSAREPTGEVTDSGREATATGRGSAEREGRVGGEINRYRITWAAAAFVALLVVLLEFGID